MTQSPLRILSSVDPDVKEQRKGDEAQPDPRSCKKAKGGSAKDVVRACIQTKM